MHIFNVFTNKNYAEHNPKWSYIQDHPTEILIIGSSGSRKMNALFNLIEVQNSDLLTATDMIYLYAKDLNEPKYQIYFKKCEEAGIKYLKDPDPNAFIKYSNTVYDVYNNIDD